MLQRAEFGSVQSSDPRILLSQPHITTDNNRDKSSLTAHVQPFVRHMYCHLEVTFASLVQWIKKDSHFYNPWIQMLHLVKLFNVEEPRTFSGTYGTPGFGLKI
jgi:hypothetical protein